ncbi:MAG TPA: NAD-dependent epimerase/dehydratase family protein [Bryobacteraceae bacterium]|nr:NAD-dependent epimerase/dehydratase family protein [Bryobacteraceae bacterium]
MAKALITGGAGFIGSHLAEHLIMAGDSVVALDNLSTGSFQNIAHLADHPNFRYLVGPLEETGLLAESVRDCDVVYHLAAAVGVQLIVSDPVRTIETNIAGTAAVLRFAVRYGKRVLLTSTSEVYGKAAKMPFSEEDDVIYGPTCRPRWAYAVSKAVDEFLLRAYVKSQGLQAIVVRLFNTVGPRQVGHYGMVIPRFVEQAVRGGPLTVYGDGGQTRCFCHVLDIVPALYRLMRLPRLCGQVVNLGSDEQVTIRHLADLVRQKINTAVTIEYVPYETAMGPDFEDMRDRQPDLRRVKDLIGFQPRFTLDQILDDIIAHRRGTWRAPPAAAKSMAAGDLSRAGMPELVNGRRTRLAEGSLP